MSESYAMVRPRPGAAQNPGSDVAYVWETGHFMLKTKEALDKGEVVTVERGFDASRL
jgi:hypothetical protein